MQHDCNMSPDDYVGALADVGLEGPQRHQGAAQLCGVDESTSRRWENGSRAIDPSACHLLLLCISQGWSWKQALNRIERVNAHARSRSARRAAPKRAVRGRSEISRLERRSVAH